jgi:hypothetical protein
MLHVAVWMCVCVCAHAPMCTCTYMWIIRYMSIFTSCWHPGNAKICRIKEIKELLITTCGLRVRPGTQKCSTAQFIILCRHRLHLIVWAINKSLSSCINVFMVSSVPQNSTCGKWSSVVVNPDRSTPCIQKPSTGCNSVPVPCSCPIFLRFIVPLFYYPYCLKFSALPVSAFLATLSVRSPLDFTVLKLVSSLVLFCSPQIIVLLSYLLWHWML